MSILSLTSLTNPWILIPILYVATWVIQRLLKVIVFNMMRLNRLASERRRWRNERIDTLKGLIGSFITFASFAAVTLFTLTFFISVDTVIWSFGLFSAAFGLGARPFISDYLTGIVFILEDTMDVGEKIQLIGIGDGIEGVIESISLRTTLIRGLEGELYAIPNGEIRAVRNFSRGRFSKVTVKLKVSANVLEKTLDVLEKLGEDAPAMLPNLIESWDVLTIDGQIGQQTEVTIVAKGRYGQGAKMKPRLLALVHKHLEQHDIHLAS